MLPNSTDASLQNPSTLVLLASFLDVFSTSEGDPRELLSFSLPCACGPLLYEIKRILQVNMPSKKSGENPQISHIQNHKS